MRIALPLLLSLTGCAVTSHSVQDAHLGQPVPLAAAEASLARPGTVTVETVIAADWSVDRAGLINLDHPRAVAAGLAAGDEPIHIAFHVIRHPTRGAFLVDSGVEQAWRSQGGSERLSWLVKSVMKTEALTVHTTTAEWLAAHGPIAGVFLTHLHLDHIMGVPDLPADVPIYVGPGETDHVDWTSGLVRGTFNALLQDAGPLHALALPPGDAGAVLDVFGDQTVFALAAPGHTAGSVAFLVRTPDGPVLLTGDACHTAWGWQHAVEPGTFSHDQPRSAETLARLKALVARHPATRVVLGHQPLPPQVAAAGEAAPPGAQRP